LLSCHTKPFGHPLGIDPERFHLIGPYDPVPKHWLNMTWIDQYGGKEFGITTTGHHGRRGVARVKTYGDVLAEYEVHPEAKCAGSDGKVCGKQTIGLLGRRHVRIERIRTIGKESNSLEDVQSGVVQSEGSIYTEYVDPKREEWWTKTLPALRAIPLRVLVRKSGLSRRMLIESRAGRSKPHRKNRQRIHNILFNTRQG